MAMASAMASPVAQRRARRHMQADLEIAAKEAAEDEKLARKAAAETLKLLRGVVHGTHFPWAPHCDPEAGSKASQHQHQHGKQLSAGGIVADKLQCHEYDETRCVPMPSYTQLDLGTLRVT